MAMTTSEYDPMCEQNTGKPPKCTGCGKYMDRMDTYSFTWNDNNSEWLEHDVLVCYECSDCDIVVDIS
jgi:TPP-dependent indolepyruvate ferredoxin oxidoreductase alpha subunit